MVVRRTLTVWEWCWDDVDGSFRRHRGGGWGSVANGCTVSTRNLDYPDNGGSSGGFRLARNSGN